jgi:acetyltransferase-like isoleucine patch superfamily enzyme
VAVTGAGSSAARWAALQTRLREAWRSRQLAAATAGNLTPPPPSAFGSFGPGSYIVPPARVTTPEAIHIGAGVIINEHSWISVVEAVPGHTPKLTIGDRTLIDRLLHLACVGEVEIGEDALIAERVLIGDTYHDYTDPDEPILQQAVAPRKVTIERGAHLGFGAIIMPGVTVGEQALVGAGAVVTRDVPSLSVVVGNPARVVRRFDRERRAWVSVDPSGPTHG